MGLLFQKIRTVCKLKKTLYSLKQASRALYARLDSYLQQQGFKREIVDNYLYVKEEGSHMLIVVVYVDDLIFGSNCEEMCQVFAINMKGFEMSMLGELCFFLGLQIHQSNRDIFISQTKYIREMLKRFRMDDCNLVSTPMVAGCKLS